MKRVLAFILAFIICLPLVSCASTEETNTVQNADTGSGEGEVVQEDTEPDKFYFAREAYAALPEIDYEGGAFVISAQAGVGSSEKEIWVEELTGDVVNDAIFNRNTVIEERFNLEIQLDAGDVNTTIRSAETAGDDSYKLAFPNLNTAASMSQSGYLANYLDYEALNTDAVWWDAGTAGLKIGGKIYFMSGDINILDNDVTYIQLFNKQLIQDVGLEEPYELVREGKWTIETFSSMCRNVTTDINGDGIYNDDDRYGYVTTAAGPNTFFYGSGLSYVSFDSEGVPFLNIDIEKITSALEKVVAIVTQDNITRIPSSVATGKEMFMADRVLFYGEVLSYIVNLREMETPFGVLPIPKYDEAQDRYYTFCECNSSTCGIPKTISDIDKVSVVLEAMAIQSYINITPAYYDIALQRKYARDDASSEMLDIALSNRVYDVGKVFSTLGLADTFQTLAASGSVDFASALAKRQKVAQKGLDKIIKSFSEQ